MTEPVDLVDSYLDRLLLELRGRAHDVRRILAETEDHLRDSVADGVNEGLASEVAEQRAIDRFGSPRTVARRFEHHGGLAQARPAVEQLAMALSLLAAIGLLAVGASGLLAAGFGLAVDRSFVAGDRPGVTYTAARCADFQEYFPHATSCEEAATNHHFEEVVRNQVAGGILGLMVLGGRFWLIRRRRRQGSYVEEELLPEGVLPTAGVITSGLVAAVCLGQGIDHLIIGQRAGAGALFGMGLAAVPVFLGYCWLLYGLLLYRATTLVTSP